MTSAKRTAQLSALVRAVGFRQREVRTRDDAAERLLDWPLQLLARNGLLRWLALAVYERKVPGAYAFALARSRYGDEQLEAAVERGVSQVLVLGAGFDTRAIRFAGKADFIEVDFPSTSAAKAERLGERFGGLPERLKLVPLDFNGQSLDVLASAGLDRTKTTLVFWEGVSFYLDAKAVDAVLAFVGQLAPGSTLVFDHLFRSTLEGTSTTDRDWPRVRAFMASKGEPFTFGVEPRELALLLGRHRLELVEHLSPAALTRRYLTDSRGQVPHQPFASFALATAKVR